MLDVGFVEVLVLAGEDDRVRPEVLLACVLVESGPHRVAFAEVQHGERKTLARSDEQVDTGAR